MKERPILFNSEMIRAILEGRKSQTRRLIKNPEYFGCFTGDCSHSTQNECDLAIANSAKEECPFGKVGEYLWVRETFNDDKSFYPFCVLYKADDDLKYQIENGQYCESIGGKKQCYDFRWKPSIHMPRWASRITLEITDIRVERLQDISELDCCAEGVGSPITRDLKKPKFRELWNSVYNNWDQDPFVWVISFKKIN